MIESNSIIKASAGTGKTFSLATRFIRQMLIDKVDPTTIVALTFSRAAAQEIYTKILMRLCAAATDSDGAKGEWETLLEDFRKKRVTDAEVKLAWIESQNISHTAADFRELLRKLVDTQHLGAIATLDSFILRIVRNFPKEMGFQNAVEVLDPIDEDDAVDEAVRLLMSKTDETGSNIAQAFTAAKRGEFSRTCLSAIAYILNKSGWRNFVVSHPECKDWTVESMCAELGVPLESECPDLSGLPFNEIHSKNGKPLSCEEQFVRFVQECDGSAASPMEAGDKVIALMRHFWENPDATSYEYEYSRRTYTFDCGADGAAAVRGAIAHIMNLYLKRQVEIVKAKIDLVKAIDSVYERQTRRAGKLTFADFTKFSAEQEFTKRGIAIQNVQFRFDSKFDHWALDEFQDTSELQWKCLKELVENVAEAGRAGDTRSAMAVGDLKQSIYTWRGASARPFEQIAGWKAFEGCERDLKESHRYGPNTVDFVNKVFGKKNISRGGIIPSVCYGAVDDWSKGWVDHVSNEAPDYVKVVGAKESADSEGDDAILSALYGELGPLWDRHCAENSSDKVGILVRNNDSGLAVAEYLRAKGLPVVWEGMSPVHDLPVVEAVLSLLWLADHPEDCYSWRTVNDLFPIRELVLPGCVDAASASAEVSRMLSKQGLSRTLKDICGTLREKGGLSSHGLSCERLKQLVEMGVNYDERGAAGGIDGFVSFLAKAQKREIAVSSDVIRIMTIHRSKGLGVDHVFVPLFEKQRSSSAIDAPKVTMPLYDGGNWVLSHLKKGSEFFNEKTRAAYEKMRSDHLMEALRTYYVALTRSKKSLFVVFPEESNPEAYKSGLLMRDLIVSAVGPTLPYEAGSEPSFKPDEESDEKYDEKSEGPTRDIWADAGTREIVERCSPSATSHSVGHAPKWMKASSLFAADHGAAAQRGLDVHAAYQKIEWADQDVVATLPPAFAEAFVKPSDDAAVWRERGYELFDGSRWETGRFDRVVFTGADGSRSAVIYDFKTNAKGDDEDDAAFSRRMCELYNSQMKSYRRALACLTGIAVDRIETKLLLEATGQVAVVR